MTTYKPVHGGFIRQCIEYVDPAWGFAIGVNFWFAVSAPRAYTIPFDSQHTVGDDYSGRNYCCGFRSEVLATDRRDTLGCVYHHIPSGNRARECFSRTGLWICRVLYVIHQVFCRSLDDILHVHYDLWWDCCHERPD